MCIQFFEQKMQSTVDHLLKEGQCKNQYFTIAKRILFYGNALSSLISKRIIIVVDNDKEDEAQSFFLNLDWRRQTLKMLIL